MTPETKYTKADKLAAVAKTALAFACLASPSIAQDDESNSPYQLDNYVTVANRIERPLDQIGSSVHLLESFDLEKGSQTFLIEALRETPGFYLRNNGGPGNAFGITTRGLNANRPTFLIDGIEVANPASGNSINPGNLFGQNVSRIEILKGPQSSLYGADALAGVISIETQSGEGLANNASVSIGSFDTYEASLGLNGHVNAFTWSFNLNHYESEGYSVQDPAYGDAWADDDGYRNSSFSTKLGYVLSDSADVFLIAYYIDSKSDFDPGVPGPFTVEFFDNYALSEQTFAKTGIKAQLADNWNSQLSVASSNINTYSHSSWSSASNGDTIQVDWQNEINLSEQTTLIAGAEYDIEDRRSDLGDRDNTSLYLEGIIAASEQLDLTLGLRHDDNSAYGSKTTYRGSFNYRIEGMDARVHGSFGTSFQAPTFFQTTGFYGNPALQAESGDGWDLGLSKAFNKGTLHLSSVLFGYDIEDKIIYSFDTSSYANEELYKSEGLETSLRFQASRNVALTASHTYSDARYGDGQEAERVPRNVYSLNANWRGLGDKLSLNARLYHASSQYSLRWSTDKQPGYTTANLAVQYQLNDATELWIRIDNAFDKDYVEIENYLTPGRALYGGANFQF